MELSLQARSSLSLVVIRPMLVGVERFILMTTVIVYVGWPSLYKVLLYQRCWRLSLLPGICFGFMPYSHRTYFLPSLRLWASTMPAEWAAGHTLVPQPQLIGLGWALHPRRAVRFSLVQNRDLDHLGLRQLYFYFIRSSQQVSLAERGNWRPERLSDLSRVSQLRIRGVIGKSDLGVGSRHWPLESVCSAMEYLPVLSRQIYQMTPEVLSTPAVFCWGSMTHFRFFGFIKTLWVSIPSAL